MKITLKKTRYLSSMVSLLSTFVFFGCATSTPTIAPDGTQAISIRCGGLSPDSCVVKAGEVCPSGYEVLSSNDAKYLGQVGTSSVSGSWSNYGGGVLGSASSLPVISANTILIRCKTIPFVAPIAKENATTDTIKPLKNHQEANQNAIEWSNKSEIASNNKQWAEAIRTATAATRISPNYLDAHINLCRAYIGYGEFKEAQLSCNKALEIDPSSLISKNNLAVISEQSNDKKKAVEIYRSICKKGLNIGCENFERLMGYSPNNFIEASNKKADEAAKSITEQKWKDAILQSTESIEINPNNESAFTSRSAAHINLKNFKLAANDANTAIDINPNMGMAYNNRGVAMLNMGQIKKAKLDFEIGCSMQIQLSCENLKKLN